MVSCSICYQNSPGQRKAGIRIDPLSAVGFIHCMAFACSACRRMPSPKGPTDPLYKAPTSPGNVTANLQPMPMRPLVGASPTSMHTRGRAAAVAAAAVNGVQGRGQQTSVRRGPSSSAVDTARLKRGDQANPPPGGGAAPAGGNGRGVAGGVLGPCRSSSGFSTAASSSSCSRGATAYKSSLDSTRSMYSCGFNSKVKGMAPGVKKVDRVARYKEMQNQWDKDRWVKGGRDAVGCAQNGGISCWPMSRDQSSMLKRSLECSGVGRWKRSSLVH